MNRLATGGIAGRVGDGEAAAACAVAFVSIAADPDDHHVLAAAIKARAQVLVT